MNELEVVFADMHRLKRAVLELNKDNKNKLIFIRVAKASVDANAAKTLDQMHAVCDELRWLFKFFMHREEPDEASDPTQGGRSASVRRSGETGNRGGNLDHPDIRPQSIPVQDMEAGRSTLNEPDRLAKAGGVQGRSSGLARTLPKRKARKSRAKPRRTVQVDNELDSKDQT